MIQNALEELSRTPFAALGGLAAILAYLDLYPARWFRRRASGENSNRDEESETLRSAMGHSVLWPASSTLVAFVASQQALALGFFLAVAAYCVTATTVYEQSKKYVGTDSSVPLSIFGVSAGIFFGVLWTRLIEVIASAQEHSPDSGGEVMLSIIFMMMTVFGGGFLFALVVPALAEEESE